MSCPLKFDTAAAISKGGRDYQEDALISDFLSGSEISMAVLSDGMGGHAAGDIASKVVVTEVYRELAFKRDKIVCGTLEPSVALHRAAETANECLTHLANENPSRAGMGATLLGLLILDGDLNWISIGDSPLFLFRDNKLLQLNEDHSFGPHIEFLVQSGTISAEEGANHPDRNVLTSVVSGRDISQVDCPDTPFALKAGDILIAASDGLQFLSNGEISRILTDRPLCRSAEIVDCLMDSLQALENPDLDNVTVLMIQVRYAPELQPKSPRDPNGKPADARPKLWSFLRERRGSAPQSEMERGGQ